jgi:hypothetical protein
MSSDPSAPVRWIYGATRVPRAWWSAWRILSRRFGHARSVRRGEPLDGAGREIPWFTYPAIEYLEQLDFRDRTVFEFGAGNSSVYWSRRAARVVSVEHDRAWYERLRTRLPADHELQLIEDPAAYPRELARRAERFDVIVVDGIERRACCAAAVARLRQGGLVILDNSDWHHHCAAALRAAGLLEVDFSGFGPVNGYTWTTSLFFHREFAFGLRDDRQPRHGIGSLPHREEAP